MLCEWQLKIVRGDVIYLRDVTGISFRETTNHLVESGIASLPWQQLSETALKDVHNINIFTII